MVTEISSNAIKAVDFFREKFKPLYGEGHLILAAHAAFPIALTPDLLYQIWANFRNYSSEGKAHIIHPIAVSDLLLSNLCREVGKGIYEMDIEIKAYLLGELQNDPRFGAKRMNLLGYFLYQYTQEVAVSQYPKSFVDAQLWTALATIAPQKAATEINQALSRAIKEGNRGEIIRMRDLLEAYANQESAFENLMNYSKGLKASIMGYPKEVIQEQFDNAQVKTLIFEEGAEVEAHILEIPLLEELENQLSIQKEIVQTPSKKAREIIQQEKKTLSGKLDLGGLQLQNIPGEVFDLIHLKELDLYDNRIQEISPEIGNLPQLEKLFLSKNPIKELPVGLKKLEKLKVLKMDDCLLSAFPEVLFQMPQLGNISFEKNKIDFLPPEVGELANLKLLDVRGNPVVNIPENMFKRTGQTYRDYFQRFKKSIPQKNIVLVLTNDSKKKFKDIQDEIAYIKSLFDSGPLGVSDLELVVKEFSNSIELFALCQTYQNHINLLHLTTADIAHLNLTSMRLPPKLIIKLLGKLPKCRLVIFNDSNTEELAKLLGQSRMMACIGHKGDLEDSQALDFTRNFYQLLAQGNTLKNAFDQGTAQKEF